MYGMLLLLGALAASQTDTTVAVQRSDRLRLELHEGDVTIRTWSRGEASFQLRDGDSRLRVVRNGSDLLVRPDARRGHDDAEVLITVPAWLPVSVKTHSGRVTIRGVESAIAVETVDGDVEVAGGRTSVSISAVSGDIRVNDARGDISLTAVNGDISLQSSDGTVAAESVNGDVTLTAVRSESVDVESVNGDVSFGGPVAPRGRYRLSTHNGDATIGMAEGSSATVTVSTFQGDFESAIPVSVRGTIAKRFSFVIGAGGARVELESFQGTVRIVRPDPAPGR